VWAFGCILLEITSKKSPWADDYSDNKVFLNALAKPENAIIFENICLTQRAPEKLRAILCHCCSWQKTGRPKFPAIVRDLSTISDIDLHNINEGKEKSLSSNSSNGKKSTSTTRAPTKTSSSSSSKVDHQDFDGVIASIAECKLENPKSQRKPSAGRRTDESGNQSTNEDSMKYDIVHDRYLYKGPRGGWYYLGPSGNKIYAKTDSI
jgi:hypothetical protein